MIIIVRIRIQKNCFVHFDESNPHASAELQKSANEVCPPLSCLVCVTGRINTEGTNLQAHNSLSTQFSNRNFLEFSKDISNYTQNGSHTINFRSPRKLLQMRRDRDILCRNGT